VAAFGRAAAWLEQLMYADTRRRGTAFTGVCLGAVIVGARSAEAAVRNRPLTEFLLTAAASWSVLGARTLVAEAQAMYELLEAGDIAGARERVTHLVGRDPSCLGEAELSRAAVESIAENTSDAVVAPLFWGALAGVPGMLGYRAVNTLDAMVGHRTQRYGNFGWASARLDDLANLAPARLTAMVAALLSVRPRQVWREASRDAIAHPSPNAGWCEAAFAAALGLRLGGTNVYAGHVETRPWLGSGRSPNPQDLPRVARLARRITFAAASFAVVVAARRGRGHG
jgi:adenosylcobinamide-phosphate synthase